MQSTRNKPPPTDDVTVALQRLRRRVETSSLDKEERVAVRHLADRMAQLHASAKLLGSSGSAPPERPLDDTGAAGASTRPQRGGGLRATVSGPNASESSQQDGKLGQAIGASLYLILESLLVRIAAQRMCLYLVNERTGDLQLAANVGIGMHRPNKNSHPPLSTGLLSTCAQTGVAVNLPQVSLEDVADCPGPGRARNAIIFPIRRDQMRPDLCIGVIIAVNHRNGSDPFTLEDEVALAQASPSIAYIARQYPVDYGCFAFDFAALHRVAPLEPYREASAHLPMGWSVPTTQLVYHREGSEKFIRRENAPGVDEDSPQRVVIPSASVVMDDDAQHASVVVDAGGSLESVATHIRTVAEYLASVQQCWSHTVQQQMDVERHVRQKQALITDAQEILHRKQAKLRHIKDVLCDHLEDEAMKQAGGISRGHSTASTTAGGRAVSGGNATTLPALSTATPRRE